MSIVVSMLRGINVSGHRKITMVQLKALYERLGHTRVITYIQSGNVVFTTDRPDTDDLADEIRGSIAGELGHDVTAVLRTAEQWGALIERNPFVERGCDPATLHVTFLADAAEITRHDAADPATYRPDEFWVEGREIYLHCPAGYGNTKLHNGFWERRFGVPATTRNWRTVTTLYGLAGG
jgi:uncharacterized protein (DUF1697 family)